MDYSSSIKSKPSLTTGCLLVILTGLLSLTIGCDSGDDTAGQAPDVGTESDVRIAPEDVENGSAVDAASDDASDPSSDTSPPPMDTDDVASTPDTEITTDTASPSDTSDDESDVADEPAPPPELDCSPLDEAGYEVCDTAPGRCEVVFTDGTGCSDVCESAGLVCGRVYEQVFNECEAEVYRPELSCSGTGHGSDYCYCVDEASCQPDCSDRSCGSDGCGGSCGSCDGNEDCLQGECVGEVPFDIEGFGRETRGGFQPGMQVHYVTSLADSGPGSLREALETGDAPRWIRFSVDGDIELDTPLNVPSNVTIDGRGNEITLRGKGFLVHGRTDVIITHLAVEDVVPDTMDGVQIGNGIPGGESYPSERVVIQNMRFTQNGDLGDSNHTDEAISVIYGSREITFANNLFDNIEKVILIGNGDAPEELDSLITVTIYGNHFHETGRRHPRARYGQIDVYNNHFNDWRMFAPLSTVINDDNWRRAFGAWCHDGCEMILEQNTFIKHPHPNDDQPLTEWPNNATRCAPSQWTSGEFEGAIDDRGYFVMPDSTAELEFNVGCDSSDPVFDRPYPATVEDADEDLAQSIIDNAGPGF